MVLAALYPRHLRLLNHRRLRADLAAKPIMTVEPTAAFAECFSVQRFANARYFAGPLFEESFRAPFPDPPGDPGAQSWAQFVAFYRWNEDRIEPVGFCNYWPLEELWLGGGLCVRKSFYRRLPGSRFEECRAAGGVAQLMMEHAARELADCEALFAYCGDARSLRVCTRVGYEATPRRHVIAKWFRKIADERKTRLIERVSALGPF
ncbi:MAG: hypothetical protein ABI537_14120 [Casimicrobiaceae bacterium]